MDAHASATAKADPEGYVTKSRELAEKKLASLYAGIIGVQSVGGVAKPTDPVSAVVMRLARRTIQKERPRISRLRRRISGWLLSIGWLPNMHSRSHWRPFVEAPGRLHIKSRGQPRGRAQFMTCRVAH